MSDRLIPTAFDYEKKISKGEFKAYIQVPNELADAFRKSLKYSACCLLKKERRDYYSIISSTNSTAELENQIFAIAKQINRGRAEIYRENVKVDFIKITYNKSAYQLHLKNPINRQIIQEKLPDGYRIAEDNGDKFRQNGKIPQYFFIFPPREQKTSNEDMQKIKLIIEKIKI